MFFLKREKLFIVSAPSGAGKSTLCEHALKEFSELEDIITTTTRQMRPGETQGNPYNFVTVEKYFELKKNGYFIETATVHNNHYGTPAHIFQEAWSRGKFLIMDVDVQGAATFRKLFSNAVYIFIKPPSIDELQKRLQKRDGPNAKDMPVRLANAIKEMEQASLFEYQIINDDFKRAYSEFREIIGTTIENNRDK